MIKVTVDAGICGFSTVITAVCEDGQNAAIKIETECPSLKPLEDELKEVDALSECFGSMCETKVYSQTGKYCKHAACPVPCGIIKAVEAACGLALPKDAVITVEKC